MQPFIDSIGSFLKPPLKLIQCTIQYLAKFTDKETCKEKNVI